MTSAWSLYLILLLLVIARRMSPILLFQHSSPIPSGEACTLHLTVTPVTPHNKLSICFKHTQWLVPRCSTYILVLFFQLPAHYWTLQRECLCGTLQALSSDWGAGAPGTVESSLSICHVCRARKRLGTHLNLLVLGTSLFFHSSREN